MKTLVTGADGFIGSHLVEALVREGHDVRAFVLYNSFGANGWLDECDPDVAGKFEVVSGDVRDPHGVRSAMEGCGLVFHLAALIGVPYSYHSPDSYVDTNVKGTLNVLQAARACGAKVVHTSTSEVYGSAQFLPMTEKHPLNAQSPYAATKVAADQLALSFHKSFGLPVTVVRPFNTYGPRQSARAFIPTVIGQIHAGAKTLKLGSLHTTRDFTFAADTVRGFIALSKAEKALGQVVNLGSNFDISMQDVVTSIAELMLKEVEIETEAERLRPALSEVDHLRSDNRNALLLGWKPFYADFLGFRGGLRETIKWFTERPATKTSYAM